MRPIALGCIFSILNLVAVDRNRSIAIPPCLTGDAGEVLPPLPQTALRKFLAVVEISVDYLALIARSIRVIQEKVLLAVENNTVRTLSGIGVIARQLINAVADIIVRTWQALLQAKFVCFKEESRLAL